MTRTDLKKLIAESTSVAICLADLKNLDKACSAVALYHTLIQVGKKSDIFVAEEPQGKVEKLFTSMSIDIKDKIEQSKYVIKIDYSKTPIEKVSFDTDEKNGKVYFYITPKGNDFDFDNVEYIKDGNDFDLTIIIGAKKFTDMGKIYESHPALFKKKKIISFSREMDSPCENFIEIAENKSYSSVVYDFVLDNIIEEPKKDVAQALLTGVVDYSNLLEGEICEEESSDISDLISEGADISKAIKFVYFSKTTDDVITQSILMSDVNVDDENGIAWATISKKDMEEDEIDPSEIDWKGRNVFNLSDEIDLSIAAYEIAENTLKLIIQSNNPARYSAIKIANVFEGKGNDTVASCTVKNATAKDFTTIFYPIMKDLYGVKEQGSPTESKTNNDYSY